MQIDFFRGGGGGGSIKILHLGSFKRPYIVSVKKV